MEKGANVPRTLKVNRQEGWGLLEAKPFVVDRSCAKLNTYAVAEGRKSRTHGSDVNRSAGADIEGL